MGEPLLASWKSISVINLDMATTHAAVCLEAGRSSDFPSPQSLVSNRL